MSEKMKFNPEDMEAEMEAMDQMVAQLERHGAKIVPDRRNVGAFAYKTQFPFEEEGGVVSIFLSLKDWQTDSDVVITNMTTLPDSRKGKGLGSRALKYILDWAAENNLNEVRATQVGQDQAENFWVKNGFLKVEGNNPTRDFIYRKPTDEAETDSENETAD
jgi:GNAT superfamily N-acetyltransferase